MIAALLLVAFQASPPLMGVVEGRVVDSVTSAPLRKANVILSPRSAEPRPPRSMMAPSEEIAVLTDSTGVFRATVPAGSYLPRVDRNGYVMGFIAGPIVVRAGETTKDVTIKLKQTGIITGRVVDEDGDPVVRATVQCMKWVMAPQYGRRILMPLWFGATDDRGEYRLFGIEPGKCRIVALPHVLPGPRPKAPQTFAPVYFPGELDLASAQPVEVSSGATRQGVDLVMRKVNIVRVSGKVSGERPAGVDHGGSIANLAHRSMALSMGTTDQGSSVNANGEFAFENVTPGAYALTVSAYGANQDRRFGRVNVDVGDRGVSGLSVSLEPVVKVAGRVRAEEGAPLASMVFHVTAVGMMPPGASAQAQSDAEGRFTFLNLGREIYRVSGMMGLPAGYYVKSVAMGQQHSPDTLDLSSGADGEVTITVEKGTAELTGQVLGNDQKPVAGVRVMLLNGRNELSKSGLSDAEGRYKLPQIIPADYRLVVSAETEEPDPDALEVLAQTAEKITLRRGARETRQLELR